MQTIAFCEINPYCRAVLKKHWPDVPCFEDIREIDANRLAQLGRIDVITGGFPCQPFSVAGKGRGAADARNLWPEMCRVVSLCRPAWVVGENVTGFITLGLDGMLADLENIGYTARPFVIPAVAVALPHRRARVWIVATNTSSHGLQKISNGDDVGAEALAPARRTAGRTSVSYVADSIGGERAQRWPPGRVWGEESVSRDRNWQATSVPFVRRGSHGIPNRMDRLRALGNAVVPQIPEIIGRAIVHCEQQQPSQP